MPPLLHLPSHLSPSPPLLHLPSRLSPSPPLLYLPSHLSPFPPLLHLPSRLSPSPPPVSMDGFSSSRNHPSCGDQLGPVSSQLVPVDLPFWREVPFCRGLCPPRTLGDAHSPFGCLLSHPHPASQQMWLRVVWRRRVSQFQAIPFALGPAPGIFNWVVRDLCIFCVRGTFASRSVCITG